MRLAHVSDLHFGRIRDKRVTSALREDIDRQGCDAVVVTGDLTQRARVWQFSAAMRWLHTLRQPMLVIPGNHDVHAWWHRPDLRLRDPLRRYQRMVTDDLQPTLEITGLSVLGVNSAYGRTIKGGYCAPGVARRVGEYFAARPEDCVKILAVHHPLTQLQGLEAAHGGRAVLEAALLAGVDVVCCGHGHIAQVVRGAHEGLLISLAGTATSSRWRAPQEGANSWHLIESADGGLNISTRTYDTDAGRFE
ncbi:MAG: metallophosphoesterase [Bacteroidota bacterium]|nr:metallophosphoesterase [Bacteroidota bacterium]MDE2833784.1 metallophosphoesterase [Bacteroidota bacterium]MDE2956152.1 metallophosphoesterase [Bacteroidota bacterium]